MLVRRRRALRGRRRRFCRVDQGDRDPGVCLLRGNRHAGGPGLLLGRVGLDRARLRGSIGSAEPSSPWPTGTPSRFTSSPDTSLPGATMMVSFASEGSSAVARATALFSAAALPAALARAAASFHAAQALAVFPCPLVALGEVEQGPAARSEPLRSRRAAGRPRRTCPATSGLRPLSNSAVVPSALGPVSGAEGKEDAEQEATGRTRLTGRDTHRRPVPPRVAPGASVTSWCGTEEGSRPPRACRAGHSWWTRRWQRESCSPRRVAVAVAVAVGAGGATAVAVAGALAVATGVSVTAAGGATGAAATTGSFSFASRSWRR